MGGSILNTKNIAEIVALKLELKGEVYTNKKLQKLLYYIQAWGIVHLNEEIINEDFQAWVHGPVLPSLYVDLKEYQYNELHVDLEGKSREGRLKELIKVEKLNNNALNLIDEVLLQYGSLSAMELELLTHSETPWLEARGDIPPHKSCSNIIKKTTMKEYYSGLIGKK